MDIDEALLRNIHFDTLAIRSYVTEELYAGVIYMLKCAC